MRVERLELSQPRLLESKTSASTNSATPAKLQNLYILMKMNKSSKDLFVFISIYTVNKTCWFTS